MTQKEEKWYLLSMKLRYFMASFFSFVLLFSGLAFFVWLLELFITIGPWMNLTLAEKRYESLRRRPGVIFLNSSKKNRCNPLSKTRSK